MKTKYKFCVPDQKRVRMIIHTDCKNEADDQFALVHHLLTPMFLVKGIVAGHFDASPKMYRSGKSASASLQEVKKVLKLMDAEEYPVYLGAQTPLPDEHTPIVSDGARFIIEQAMQDDPHPLYIACQGALTDLASALLLKPEIAERITAVWIGGATYPAGGFEFNLLQDIAAANVLMKSQMPFWQIPGDAYRTMMVTLSELQLEVEPCGEIGRYLFRQLLEVNEELADTQGWPNGETWCLGDSPTIGVFLNDANSPDLFREYPAPSIDYEDMTYHFDAPRRSIRVYHRIDPRLILADLFAKLKINYL